MTQPVPPRAFALLATSFFVLGGSATVAASTVPDDSTPASSSPSVAQGTDVVVTDEGAADPRINLDAVPIVAGSVLHSVKTNEGSGEIHLSGAETLDATVAGITTIEQTAEVLEVAPDGGFTVERTVDAYDFVVTEGPEELADFLRDDEELAPLVGVALVQVYDADRVLLSVEPADPSVTLTADQEAAIAEIIDEGADAVQVPDAELGVGATWTSFLSGSKGATAEFELLSLDATEATIGLTVDGDASLTDPESPLQNVAGTVTGSGSMTVDLTNSLAADSTLELSVDMTGTTEGFDFAMTLDSTTTNVVTVG
jgi:hypothetical protein